MQPSYQTVSVALLTYDTAQHVNSHIIFGFFIRAHSLLGFPPKDSNFEPRHYLGTAQVCICSKPA